MFNNTYARLPAGFFQKVQPTPVSAPKILLWNAELAAQLGLAEVEDPARFFSGNHLLDGAEPIAMAYAGHQFAHFVPQLGDGRAILLGEIGNLDIQLKGSGVTPFSRSGDGRSAIGPVLREFIVSEAMHSLGIPTTRSLAAVSTGDLVQREHSLPGGILTRVSKSHIRVGTFEYFASRNDLESLKLLREYTIRRLYPNLEVSDSLGLFQAVLRSQAQLVARWMGVGFIHGVMNTDNFSISGETIDYGPCAFMDEFIANKTFSSIDRRGRYAYNQQPSIASWNLARFADCLIPITGSPTPFQEVLDTFQDVFYEEWIQGMRLKLGLLETRADDGEILTAWFTYLESESFDFTNSFRELATWVETPPTATTQPLQDFLEKWTPRIHSQSKAETQNCLNAHNPAYIPRNHQIEQVIQDYVEHGDLKRCHDLLHVLKTPFADHPSYQKYREPPSVHERVHQTFCGT